jgi:hypothetical protein
MIGQLLLSTYSMNIVLFDKLTSNITFPEVCLFYFSFVAQDEQVDFIRL